MRPTSSRPIGRARPRGGIALVALGAALIVACGGDGRPAAQAPVAVTAVQGYPATRWVPARPTYAITARTVRDAQRGLRDVVASVGAVVDVELAEVADALRAVLRVDPLSADTLAAIGVELDGGFAMFSEGVSPTLVVHLAAPAQFQAFLDQQQDLRAQSVVVDGIEVFTALLPGTLRLSWAVAGDWLWLHAGLRDVPGEAAAEARWFAASYRPGAPTWAADLAWARGSGTPAVAGVVDLPRLLATLGPQPIADAAACVRLVEPVRTIALAIDGEGERVAARLGVDLGPSAQAIARAMLPVPEGWRAAAARVPLAVQWNLDLAAVRPAIAPCARLLGLDLAAADRIGIRGGRALVRSFDPDDRSGTGAIALDLAHARFFAARLDDIPLRSALERKRTFGPHAGRTLAVPMVVTIDYVLTDALALAAVGDGLLAAIVGQGGTAPGPVFALDVQPRGLSREAWLALVELAGIPARQRVVDTLLAWREARIAVAIDGSRLVLAASGTRR